MPAKPVWISRLPRALRQLEATSEPWVDRLAVQSLLGVGRRRAQQLLAPVSKRRVGTNVLADRTDVIAHLKEVAAGKASSSERQRRKQLWDHLAAVPSDWQSPVLVEVSQSQIRQIELDGFDGLPDGIELSAGCITIRFPDPGQALQKLLTLAIAIKQNRRAFDAKVAVPTVVDDALHRQPER